MGGNKKVKELEYLTGDEAIRRKGIKRLCNKY